jgi:hypothetical protein
MPTLMPQGLARRLRLAFLGYRALDGWWVGPGPDLTEEEVDGMTPRQWSRWVARRPRRRVASRAMEARR